MTTTEPLNLPALAAELAQVQAQKANLTEREESIKELFRDNLDKGKHDAGIYTITVTPNRRIDEARVRAAYPPDRYPNFYKQVVHTDGVKALVEPAVYDALLGEVGKRKISIA
ncbi:MAG: hypothetical protein ACRD0W_21835 [Acidimicrobiales bacterium]